MTGTAINAGAQIILAGTPLAEDENGNVFRADSDNPAFAIAIAGGNSGMVIPYVTEGTIERGDWFQLAGTKLLVPREEYYLVSAGIIGTDGSQPIGIARSPTVLRIQIGPVIRPITTEEIEDAVAPLIPATSLKQIFGVQDSGLDPSTGLPLVVPLVTQAIYIADDGSNFQWFAGQWH